MTSPVPGSDQTAVIISASRPILLLRNFGSNAIFRKVSAGTPLQEQADATPPMAVPQACASLPGLPILGARLRSLRKQRGLPLREVAAAVDTSTSFLSAVERGETDLSLARFSRLAEFFQLPPSELLLELNTAVPEPVISASTSIRTIDRGPGIDYRILQDENPQMIYARIEPGARFADASVHHGHDFWYVAGGRVELVYGDRRYSLAEGQSVRFSATIPHTFVNPHAEPVILVALCSVPLW